MAVKELNWESFKDLDKKGVVVLKAWADWCGPCQMMAPVIDDLSKDMGDKASVGKLNVDDSRVKASEFGVMSIPTIKIFKDGKMGYFVEPKNIEDPYSGSFLANQSVSILI